MKIKYLSKSFRLSQETIDNLEKIKKEKGISYNLLFWNFIKNHNKPFMTQNLIENDVCPYCNIGIIKRKQSKYGEFLACNNFPRCAAKQSIKEPLNIGMKGFKDNELY